MATTVRPTGVGARWRTLTSLPTVTQPAGKCGTAAAAEAIAIARIIMGVPKTNGMPSPSAPDRELTRNNDLVPASHAGPNVVERLRHLVSRLTLPHRAYSNVAPQDPQM